MTILMVNDWTDAKAWDTFVEGHDQARFCHLFRYGDVVACYGYRPIRIAFVRDRSLVAVVPAALTTSLLFGRRLVSQPFSEYGGLLIDPSLDSEDVSRIFHLIEDYLERHSRIRSIELHGRHGIPAEFGPGPFALANPHHVAVLALDHTPDQLWQKVVQYSVRKGVNKAQGQGVVAFEESDPTIIRERFYPLYLKSMKRLGVPPHALAYYLSCSELLGERLKIFWAAREREILAGLLGFVCGGRVNIVNIVSEPQSWKYAPNDLIHWEFVKWAAEQKLRYFDFGSVRYEGQRTYKKKWGATFEEHGYYLLSRNQSAAAQAAFSSSSPGMTRLSQIWSRFVPEPVAQVSGPFIRKHLVR